ncbi:hypothetical protein AXG93_3036s1000 [Marchantia polymorpha subsp. ruderalis]|uniref:FBD domain-containing protein n=1 Tax=Marchantia polymorpha subsp. ruderalis TaxID=1480154 RepID=A0A176W8K3_MARPO|nr:hypothetical protein AXG93_3036s1000 [Marchantia polymorpha subsp. ruderalis]
MEEETVEILSQAVIQSSSLETMILDNVKWGAALLLKALAGHDGNRSIEHLYLMNLDGLGDCLGELLTSNPSLKVVDLQSRMSPEEWHQLGEVVRDNAIATNLIVWFQFVSQRKYWESIEAFARVASSDVKDPTLELKLYPATDHDVMLSLNLLGRVLRGDIKSLKSFHLLEFRQPNSGSNQDRLEGSMEGPGLVLAREHKSNSLGFA